MGSSLGTISPCELHMLKSAAPTFICNFEDQLIWLDDSASFAYRLSTAGKEHGQSQNIQSIIAGNLHGLY